MATHKSFRFLVLILILTALFVAGCTRVFRSQDDVTTVPPDNSAAAVDESANPQEQAELPDTPEEALEEVGGADPGAEAGTGDASTTDENSEATGDSSGETPREDETAEEVAESTTDPSDSVAEEKGTATEGEESANEEEAPTDTTAQSEGEESAPSEGEEAADNAETTDAETTAAEGENVADESTTADPTATNGETNTIAHVVQPGENLYRIGLLYGVSWVTLSQLNGLGDADIISAGQVIQVPAEPTPEPTATPSPTTEVVYIVQPGDSLFSIGLIYGLTWDQIAEANGIVNPNAIYTGQELKIPAGAPGPAPQFMHTVEQGDTLLRLSVRYGVTWQAIAEANALTSPYVLYPGQTLLIPGQ